MPQHRISTSDLLEDLRRVAEKLGKSPTQNEYNDHGTYSHWTIANRFDGWNEALKEVDLTPNRDHDTHTVQCDYCETVLQKASWELESNEYHFCSRDCYKNWCSEHRTGEDHPRYTEYPDLECEQCGTTYSVRPSKADHSRFCSYDYTLGRNQRMLHRTIQTGVAAR